MKTLIYTSIYSYLWGTEFGGRPSRERHYKLSLKKIIELNADKYICFVPQNELNDVTNFFYIQNKISTDKLEFIVFDLNQTKYFNQLRKLKDIDSRSICFIKGYPQVVLAERNAYILTDIDK